MATSTCLAPQRALRLRLTATALMLLGAGGCAPTESAPSPPASQQAAQPIVGGEVDEGHPAVVSLTVSGRAFCSGTLVTPTLVVTAAHCLDASNGVFAEDIEVFFGTNVREEGTFIEAVQVVAKPDWYLNDPNLDDDIGVVRLAEVGPAEPIPLGQTPPVGTTLTMVGFGITASEGNGAGVKRVTTATIVARDPKIFFLEEAPGATCSGDSGGTALALIDGVETLVGVHTRSDCVGSMIDERLDAHEDFLAPYLIDPTCDADGQCALGCDVPDPDCPCATDGFCTVECPDLARDRDCPPACGGPGNGCGRGCPVRDPDCPACIADGRCDLGCDESPDPDCIESTVGVGPATGVGGGVAQGEGGGGGNDAARADEGGCSAAQPGQRRDGAFFLLALAGLAARPRRRSG